MDIEVTMLPGWEMEIIDALRPDMSRFVSRIAATARRNAPKITGNLASHINPRVNTAGEGEVDATAFYARWVMEGTGFYGPLRRRIYPLRAPFMVFRPKGSPRMVYARSTRGQEPKPFLTDALTEELAQGFQ